MNQLNRKFIYKYSSAIDLVINLTIILSLNVVNDATIDLVINVIILILIGLSLIALIIVIIVVLINDDEYDALEQFPINVINVHETTTVIIIAIINYDVISITSQYELILIEQYPHVNNKK